MTTAQINPRITANPPYNLEQWCECRHEDMPLRKCNKFRAKSRKHPLDENGNEVVWNPSMPSRGLGDSIAKFTHVTGISKGVKLVSQALGFDCGCGERQEALNEMVPFKPPESAPP